MKRILLGILFIGALFVLLKLKAEEIGVEILIDFLYLVIIAVAIVVVLNVL